MKRAMSVNKRIIEVVNPGAGGGGVGGRLAREPGARALRRLEATGLAEVGRYRTVSTESPCRALVRTRECRSVFRVRAVPITPRWMSLNRLAAAGIACTLVLLLVAEGQSDFIQFFGAILRSSFFYSWLFLGMFFDQRWASFFEKCSVSSLNFYRQVSVAFFFFLTFVNSFIYWSLGRTLYTSKGKFENLFWRQRSELFLFLFVLKFNYFCCSRMSVRVEKFYELELYKSLLNHSSFWN